MHASYFCYCVFIVVLWLMFFSDNTVKSLELVSVSLLAVSYGVLYCIVENFGSIDHHTQWIYDTFILAPAI